MRLLYYLMDKKYLIIFYIILMTFISTVVYLDPSYSVHSENIFYINIVSLILFIIYIMIEYLCSRKYYKAIIDLLKYSKDNLVERLPKHNTYEQGLYMSLMKNMYRGQDKRLEKLYKNKIENLEFVTSWVHEIKTPISASRLVIENANNRTDEQVLDSLEEELDIIEDYVEKVLYYARLDSFSKDYLINEINLDRIVKGMVKKHAKTFISKKIKINIDDVDFDIISDEKWLEFIIGQILSNALKYTDHNGEIHIYGKKNKKEKLLIIEDNGIGIKEEDKCRVFNKGFTGYIGRKNNKSTGLGLYLAKRLALKLGHDLSIESEYGKYTKVIIHFPKLTDYFNVTKV
ncbi:sensor histidine kinase [Clostridiisalibacter paucivorans]|uniref:sensor histidine kinase n=1 Tax=Clostridiisalibacter paucivorans TaxID=408753 RepID=UPI00047CADE0|nr:sensor histidine kinase [Clostridiisalibacter paucivorans]